MADIGGGDGARITNLLTKAHKDFPTLHFDLTFIEPSHTGFPVAQKRFDGLCAFVTAQAQNTRFEEAHLPPGAQDFVLFCHSIYTFSNDSTIRRIADLKKDAGTTLVIGNHPASLLKKLNERMHVGFTEKRYELTDFLNDLSRLEIPYAQQEEPTRFHVDEPAFNDYAAAILTMTSMGAYPSFLPKEKEEAHDFLRSLAVKREGTTLHYEETEVFVLVGRQRGLDAG